MEFCQYNISDNIISDYIITNYIISDDIKWFSFYYAYAYFDQGCVHRHDPGMSSRRSGKLSARADSFATWKMGSGDPVNKSIQPILLVSEAFFEHDIILILNKSFLSQ